jgi:hypothetical protein
MPPQARRRAKSDNSPGMRIEYGGKTYMIRQTDMTGQDTRALRQEVGLSFAGLFREMQADPDIDLIGAFIWLARRIDGETVSYDEVLETINYGSSFEIGTTADKPGDDDSPEA